MFFNMRKGQRFHCQNAQCGCQMEVIKESATNDTSNPRCGCGAAMKKAYVKPTVTTRPLLRSDFPQDSL
jgi:hypothetical protein